MEDFLELNLSKRLHELNYGITVKLANAMCNNWKAVLLNIPDNPLSPSEIEQYFEKQEIQGKRPAEAIFTVLGKRGVRLDALKITFEKLNFEEGLCILGCKTQTIKSRPLFVNEISLNNGMRLELACETTGFPVPRHYFYKNRLLIFEGNPFVIQEVNVKDSGFYECFVQQGDKVLTFSTLVTVRQLPGSIDQGKFTVNVEPQDIYSKVGAKFVEINAIVKENIYQKQLYYQWFKSAKRSSNDEAIVDNPTAKTSTLVLQDLTIEDAGTYKCLVSDGINLIMSSERCKLTVKPESQFDLKMALIIGNGDYVRHNCFECENEKKITLENLCVSSNIIDLKHKLEENDFIVMTYIDLEAENFLRVIRLFKEKCEAAKNVLAFIYIGAHGFHFGAHDFLVPVDLQDKIHENHNSSYKSNRIGKIIGPCSLANLLENFSNENSSESSTKFSVICFWDLCRATNIDFPTDSYSIACRNLQYTIIYCCNVGSNAYEIPGFGSIILKLFLEQFKDNCSLNDILVLMNKRIKEIQEKHSKFKAMSELKVHSTLGDQYILSFKARFTRNFKSLLDNCYFSTTLKTPVDIKTKTGKYFRFYYKILRDEFLNTALLDVEEDGTFCPFTVTCQNKKIRIESPDDNTSCYYYRIKGIQNLMDEDLTLIFEFNMLYEVLKKEITIPNTLFSILRHLNNENISEYVNSKMIAAEPISSFIESVFSDF